MATAVECVSIRAKLESGMICSRVPLSAGTGCVVPGVVDCDVDPADVVVLEVALRTACDW